MSITPESLKGTLTPDQYKLYKLIFERFVASQMKNAELDIQSADFECAGYIFKSSEYVISFKGYMLVYDDSEDEDEAKSKLPVLTEGDKLTCESLEKKQNFTDPPAHFTEGSLIRFLEEKGIGRPSTYAPTITTIVDRGYVRREKKLLLSTPLGEATVKIMKDNFPEIVDYRFTAKMEENLDKIARGEDTENEVLSDFYTDFEKTLDKAHKSIGDTKVKIPDEESDIVCEKCGRRMVIKSGRFGKFAACPGYPECKSTVRLDRNGKPVEKKPEPEKTDLKCEKCGEEDIVIRHSAYGKFLMPAPISRNAATTKTITRPDWR